MLNKIAIFTFVWGVGATWLLRHQHQPLDQVLEQISFDVPIAGLTLPLGTILPAAILALLSRVFKLHDLLSTAFGIRRRFDVFSILLPMAVIVGARLSADQIREVWRRRQKLMADHFYKYASSTPGKAKIDEHHITMALDQWSWYWIFMELDFVVAVSTGLLLLWGYYKPAALLSMGFVVVLIVLHAIMARCRRYALVEVQEITNDADRRQKIREDLSALSG